MQHYKVFLNGENFWLNFDEKPSKMGFYTNRYVLAINPEEAENSAVQMLREDSKLENVLNDRSDPPMIYCEKIEQSDAFDPSTVVQQGFTFYVEETNL